MVAEAAKRRLVHQLDELALPIAITSSSVPDGSAFDLVHLPGEGGITGHLDGVLALDVVDTDDRHRDDLRRRPDGPFTVIGHLRHEIGHHYWARLVGQTNELGGFRRLFGDERRDSSETVGHADSGVTGPWDRTRFVTSRAAAHPLEDWAETFAHYLHIVDALDTPIAHDLSDGADTMVADVIRTSEFAEVLDAWRPINTAMNAIAEKLGTPAVHPFEPTGAVVDKLAFVHRQVTAHTERDRFYAEP